MHLYRKNDNDQKIPEYNDKDHSKAFVLHMKSLTGMQPPPIIGRSEDWSKFSTQFHLTFFYENPKTNERFFFGRSSKTAKIPLKKDGNAFKFDEEHMDTLFFHTCLTKSSLDDKIFLVIECVIIAEREERGAPVTRHLSGGFAKYKMQLNQATTSKKET